MIQKTNIKIDQKLIKKYIKQTDKQGEHNGLVSLKIKINSQNFTKKKKKYKII